MLKFKANRAVEKRQGILRREFPGWEHEVWHRSTDVGYTTVPKTISLIMRLMKMLCKGCDPSAVYLDLWCRIYDDSLIEVRDPREMGYASGFGDSWAVKAWRQRIRKLEELGFIKIAKRWEDEIGYVFLRHPDLVIQELQTEERIPSSWLKEYEMFLDEVKAKRFDVPKKARSKGKESKITPVPRVAVR